jgi:KDO2-lipid IV(A) lauroyltransferase
MYYIIYPFLYLLSLLPWRVIYLVGDGLYVLMYHVIRYRREVVIKNLLIAFPEKTLEERQEIARQFYHNLADTFVETIKLLSISDRSLAKRYKANSEVLYDFYDTGRNIQLHAGHFFNIEFVTLGETQSNKKFPLVGVYMPLSSKAFDRILLNLRSRYGGILIPAVNFKAGFKDYVCGRYALALAADQNPPNLAAAHWIKFFDRPTPFSTGPEKGARNHNTIVVFANFYREKRGYFRMHYELMSSSPCDMEEGALTRLFVKHIEKAIRERPANYLWSHRRWKWEFNAEKHGHLLLE